MVAAVVAPSAAAASGASPIGKSATKLSVAEAPARAPLTRPSPPPTARAPSSSPATPDATRRLTAHPGLTPHPAPRVRVRLRLQAWWSASDEELEEALLRVAATNRSAEYGVCSFPGCALADRHTGPHQVAVEDGRRQKRLKETFCRAVGWTEGG